VAKSIIYNNNENRINKILFN